MKPVLSVHIDTAVDRLRDFLMVNMSRDRDEKSDSAKIFATRYGLDQELCDDLAQQLGLFVGPDYIVSAFIGVLLGLSIAEERDISNQPSWMEK